MYKTKFDNMKSNSTRHCYTKRNNMSFCNDLPGDLESIVKLIYV